MRVSNAAGFTIDWLLKRYEPAGSSGVNPTSNPGTRDIEIDIGLQSIATLPMQNNPSLSITVAPAAPNQIPIYN